MDFFVKARAEIDAIKHDMINVGVFIKKKGNLFPDLMNICVCEAATQPVCLALSRDTWS